MVRGLGLVHNNGRHVLVVRTGAGLVLLLAAAQGPRVLLLPAAGQTAQRRWRVLVLLLVPLLVLLLMLGLVLMLWLLMLLIDHNIIVVSAQQLRGQGHPPHGHHLVTSAAPERGAVLS